MSKTTNKYLKFAPARCEWFWIRKANISSRWATVSSIAAKIGCTAQTLNGRCHVNLR